MEESLVSIDVHDESWVENVFQKMYLFLRTIRQFVDVGWMNCDYWVIRLLLKRWAVLYIQLLKIGASSYSSNGLNRIIIWCLVYCSVWILRCFEIFFARNNRLGRSFERNRCIITNITSIVCFWCQLRWFVFPVGWFTNMLATLVVNA